MAKEKQIQMPESWLIAVYRYMHGDDSQRDFILKGIENKVKRMMEHDLYSIMHDKNKTDEEREQARQSYLNSKGIPENFRW